MQNNKPVLDLDLVVKEIYNHRSMVDYEFNVHSNGLWGFSFKQGHQGSDNYRYGTSEEKEGVLLAIDMFIINASAVNNDNILQEIRDYLVETLADQVSWSIN
ncbi:hypothetical protein HO924_09345 [Streptococcus suis]|nr:hypothetical protein [Streptococcus suis]